MMSMTLKGWGWVALLYAGLLTLYSVYGGPTVFLLLAFSTLLICGELLFVLAGPRKIEIERSLQPGCVMAGEAAEITVTVSFHSLVPVPWMTITDQLNGMSYRHLLLPGWHRSFTYSYIQEQLNRGIYDYSHTEIEWGGMFGICTGRRRLRREGRLVVLPSPIRLDDLSKKLRLKHVNYSEGEGTSLSGSPGIELREYWPGDPLNRIHWKSSARKGQLMFRLPENEERVDLTLVLDRDISSYRRVSGRVGSEVDQEAFEIAVSTAAGLISRAEESGQEIELICLGAGMDNVMRSGMKSELMRMPGTADSLPLLLRLAAVEPSTPYSLGAEWKRVRPAPEGREEVAFVTGRLHEEMIPGLQELLTEGIRLHIYYSAPGPVITTALAAMEASGEQQTALSIVHRLTDLGVICHYVGDRTASGQAVNRPSWKGGSSHAGSK